MSIVSLAQMLFLAVVLFLMGAACAMTRRNLIMILIGVEVMLNAAGIALVAGAMRWQQVDGQVMTLFVMMVAAAEVAVGLALIVYMQRRTGSVNADRHDLLKG
jgi:NADH-quinone oxidoreductase subunit K